MATKDISDLQVCEAVKKYQNDHETFADEILIQMTGQPYKVCIKAMERADGKGLIDCGVSLRTSWLTNKGLELLESKAKH